MKNRLIRSITLSRETLRRMQPGELEAAAGGRTLVSDCPAHCVSAGGSQPPCGGTSCLL